MSRILAIDPGPVESAWVIINEACYPITFGKEPNELVRRILETALHAYDKVVIEMVASYGMPVGAEVFETCVEIGRMVEVSPRPVELVYRREVKRHHCGSVAAKDSNITQSLVDRFAKGQPNRGKGTKNAPGWFHGFAADVWQAYALAVYAADTTRTRKAS